MISIKDQQKVMLIRWLQRAYIGTSFTQQKVISYFLKNIGGIEYIINTNTNSKDFQGLHLVKSLFWRNAINTWIDLKKVVKKQATTFHYSITMTSSTKIKHCSSRNG